MYTEKEIISTACDRKGGHFILFQRTKVAKKDTLRGTTMVWATKLQHYFGEGSK
jgi:hypothetical protein